MLVPASALAADGFTSGVTAGEITSDVSAHLGSHQSPGVRSGPRSPPTRLPEHRQAAGPSGERRQQLHGPDHVRPARLTTRSTTTASASWTGARAARWASSGPPRAHLTSKTIRFAFSGDETGSPARGRPTPSGGTSRPSASMVAENNHFNIDFGDTIYSDPEVPGAPTALTCRRSGTCTGRSSAS